MVRKRKVGLHTGRGGRVETMSRFNLEVVGSKKDEDGMFMCIRSERKNTRLAFGTIVFRDDLSGIWYRAWRKKKETECKDQEAMEQLLKDWLVSDWFKEHGHTLDFRATELNKEATRG